MIYYSPFSVPLFEISGALVSLDAETPLLSINKVRSAARKDARGDINIVSIGRSCGMIPWPKIQSYLI